MKKKKPQQKIVSDATIVLDAPVKPNSISGSLVQATRDSREVILYLATNASQIEMACLMAKRSSYESIIYSEGYDFYDCSQKFSEAYFVSSLKNVAAIFKRVSKIVTYIGQVNPNIKKEYRTLLSSALRLTIPVIELPHGLFQSGYNLDDSSKIIDLSSYYDGIGKSLPSIASLRLKWYGAFSIGYPRHVGLERPMKVLPCYTVITTNTNWFLYTVEDKRNFFNIVWKYAESNPDKIFIWSPHPAETNHHTYSHSVASMRPSNVLIYGLKQDIYFDGIDNTNDLIAYASEGISTLSTCVLEYEMHQKNVKVFSTNGISNLLKTFKSVQIFQSLHDIEEPAAKLVTGMLEHYDALQFDEYLASAPSSDPKNAMYLELA